MGLSFRRRPESSGFNDLLDTGGQARHDDVALTGQQCLSILEYEQSHF
ncbi:MAG: hypothetical protein GXP23_01960 [Gammaproteobacteria bacterium]|nr:hypothetical protein [Gammaproteobacteria bacterium]